MNQFIHPILGGLMIGTSATLLLFWLGRIAGISGILSGILSNTQDRQWRLIFIVGILLGALIFQLLNIEQTTGRASLPVGLVITAGLLVGLGSVIGGGCTSGHAVCGLGRLSKRSIIATCTFVAFAMLSTYFLRHVLGAL